MSAASVDVTHEGGLVLLTMCIGTKTARVKVTPEKAEDIAQRLMLASLEAVLGERNNVEARGVL